jgi:glycine/D-amino acid oxidase-like deaminating enzyme
MSPPTLSTTPKHIVIVGGGIIGTCTAYSTSTSPHFHPESGDKITLVEAAEVAGAASGKAGGLLALDWHGQATASKSDELGAGVARGLWMVLMMCLMRNSSSTSLNDLSFSSLSSRLYATLDTVHNDS